MSERYTVYVLPGSNHPMVTVRSNRKDGTRFKTADQVGCVYAVKGKTQEDFQKELARVIVDHSPILSTWFQGKLTLKQKLVRRFGQDAGLTIYRLMQQNQEKAKALGVAKKKLQDLDAGSFCETCATYHPQGSKGIVVDGKGHVFCNPGCQSQYRDEPEEVGDVEFEDDDEDSTPTP